ncbi:hypothetical protein EC09BKT24447_2963 [Escherichia coli 09BKT024447]|nr:hypothetical protein EC09BKT24447_2963 [Escherichia coli 09BKT024447]
MQIHAIRHSQQKTAIDIVMNLQMMSYRSIVSSYLCDLDGFLLIMLL